MTGNDGKSVKVVDRDAKDAKYKIVGQFTHKTEADNQTQNPCGAYPTTEIQFWYGKAGNCPRARTARTSPSLITLTAVATSI